MWPVMGWICDQSWDGYVASHGMDMWPVMGWICDQSFDGYVASHVIHNNSVITLIKGAETQNITACCEWHNT